MNGVTPESITARTGSVFLVAYSPLTKMNVVIVRLSAARWHSKSVEYSM